MIFLVTAFSVSIDAYVAGLAFSIGTKTSVKHIVCVFVFTFLLSITALFVGGILSRWSELFQILGAVLFVMLGIKNVYGYYSEKKPEAEESAPLVGLGVGMDAGVACLAFSVSFLHATAIALVMAIFHSGFFILGRSTARFLQTAEHMSFASGVFLILLGLSKLF